MLFRKRDLPPIDKEKTAPEGWTKCEKCGALNSEIQLNQNYWVCPNCNYHFRIPIKKHISYLFDTDWFVEEIASNLESLDPLDFPDYIPKLRQSQQKTGLRDACVAGIALIGGYRVVFFGTDFFFMGGSMGSVMGECFYRAAKRASQEKIPLVSLTSSGGGARMQEGVVSLMQLVKTIIGVQLLEKERVPFISILCDPTMGGVMASFASLGDIILAEPGALLGFAGPRVIRDTIREELPPGFQTSEFLLKRGMIDMVVHRKDIKPTLIKILKHFVKDGTA